MPFGRWSEDDEFEDEEFYDEDDVDDSGDDGVEELIVEAILDGEEIEIIDEETP